jgi:uncharacterized protein YebE (UPF0316 family)
MFETLLIAFGIFLIRIFGNTISTLRLVMLARERDGVVFVLSFFESLTFAIAIGAVVTNLDSVLNLIAYSAGYAIGSSLGVWLERQLTLGFVQMTTISPGNGRLIADAVRDAGFGATEINGYGAEGEVLIIETVIERQNLKRVMTTVQKIDPDAFITTRTLQSTRRGFIPAVRPGLNRVLNRSR